MGRGARAFGARAGGALALAAAVTLSGCTGSHHGQTAAERSAAIAAGPASDPAGSPVPPSSVPTPSGTPSADASPTASRTRTSPKPSQTAGRTSKPPAAPARYGNPSGHAAVPAAAQAVDTAHPNHVVGHGTAASCTSAAVVKAVAAGGVITFNCGPSPVTITLTTTAKVRNTSSRVVLDGGGKVTLSGGGRRRILYQDTCDQAQVWTTSHCQDQASPQLVLQNLTFADGNSTGQTTDGGGGGAVFVRGGRVKVVNSRFISNRCDPSGPDLGGAALRVLSQYHGQPVYIVNSTFGGAPGLGGSCSNGGGVSSIGVSWVILNCLFANNHATGRGANPAQAGTPGGGSGGAIYTDGNTYTVTIAGTAITGNHANAGGGAIFFVSNDRTGTLSLDDSRLRHNVNDGFQTAGLPGIFFLGARPPTIRNTPIS